MPQMQDIMLNMATETQIGDSLVYLCRNRAFTVEQLLIKRIMDIVVSLLILVVTSPIMLITAIAIKLYDGGPVFSPRTLSALSQRLYACEIPEHGR